MTRRRAGRPPTWSIGAVRVGSLVEAGSYIVLLAVVVVHALGGPDLTPPVGLVHGLIYLGYAALVLVARRPLGWSTQQTAQALVVAAVPLGALAVHREVTERSREAMRST